MPITFSRTIASRIAHDPHNCKWKQAAKDGAIVEAVKELRALTGASLKEAKDTVEWYMNNGPTLHGLTIIEPTPADKPTVFDLQGAKGIITPLNDGSFKAHIEIPVAENTSQQVAIQALFDWSNNR